MVLTFQLSQEKDSIEILFDKNGLEMLRSVLGKTWEDPKNLSDGLCDFDHEHLFSEEWGGNELTPEFTSEGCGKIQSVKIVYFGQDADSFLGRDAISK